MKTKNYLILLSICLMGGMALASCSSDDDDEGAASNNAGVIEGKANVRVTQVGRYRFYYDKKGRVDQIEDNYSDFRFSYSPNKVICTDEDNYEEELSISYNSNGYVSRIEGSSEGKEGNETWSISGSASYSYDGKGHITRISSQWKEIDSEDGKKYSETGTVSIDFTWKNDLLMTITENEKYVEDGDTETAQSSQTFTYDTENDKYLNEYLQYVPCFSEELEGVGDGDVEEPMSYIGLMGKGPRYLPTSSKKEWSEYYDGRDHSGSYSRTYQYGLNADGTIAYASSNNSSRIYYSYSTLSNDDYDKVQKFVVPTDQSGKMKGIVHRMFSHSRHHSTIESKK